MRNTTIICECTEPDGSVQARRIKLSSLQAVYERIEETRQRVASPTAADFGDVHMQQSIVYYAREALPDNVVDCAQLLIPEPTVQPVRRRQVIVKKQTADYTWTIITIAYGFIGALLVLKFA